MDDDGPAHDADQLLGSAPRWRRHQVRTRHRGALQAARPGGQGVPRPRAVRLHRGKGRSSPLCSMMVARHHRGFYAGESLRSVTTGYWTEQGAGAPRQRQARTPARCATSDQPRATPGGRSYQGEIATDNDGNRVRGNGSRWSSEEVFDVIRPGWPTPARKTTGLAPTAATSGRACTCAPPASGRSTINGGKYFCAGHLIREHRHVDGSWWTWSPNGWRPRLRDAARPRRPT